MGGLAAAIGSAGGAAVIAAGAFAGVYKSLEWALGRARGDNSSPMQPGAEQYPRVSTDGTGPRLPGYQPNGFEDLRSLAAPPSWTVNQPQKSFPMTGAGGATAGAEGPDYPGITPGIGDLQSQLQQAGNGAGEAGAKAAGDFGSGFLGQLEETVSRAGQLIEQLRGMLDFSASPKISPTGDAGASAPRRTSSLGSYDHRRASGAEITELS